MYSTSETQKLNNIKITLFKRKIHRSHCGTPTLAPTQGFLLFYFLYNYALWFNQLEKVQPSKAYQIPSII